MYIRKMGLKIGYFFFIIKKYLVLIVKIFQFVKKFDLNDFCFILQLIWVNQNYDFYFYGGGIVEN